MDEYLKLVQEFHEIFEVGVGENFKEKLPDEIIKLRHRLMEEENNEYLEAASKGDYVEVADALGDKLYVLMGTIVQHGMQEVIGDVFREIHRSNMSKLGIDGKPVYRNDGKVIKGPNYTKPNIKSVL